MQLQSFHSLTKIPVGTRFDVFDLIEDKA